MTVRNVAITSKEMKVIKDEFDKSIADYNKRVRAEVLTACIKHIDPDWLIEILRAYNTFAELDPPGTYPRNIVEEGIENLETLEKLQPAASDLEEYVKNLPLSEIARIKGLPGVVKLGKTYDRPVFHATEDE